MNVSGYYRRRENEGFFLSLDVMPKLDEASLTEKLERRKASLGDCFLDALLPEKLAAVMQKGQTPASLAHLLKHIEFTPVASKGWKDAHTTSGGIALDEIDPGTMESKLMPGLYAAGEALDVDGPCGGYSLTWAFASGWIAGQNAARNR
jgi:predicted flavoprotein YhiN